METPPRQVQPGFVRSAPGLPPRLRKPSQPFLRKVHLQIGPEKMFFSMFFHGIQDHPNIITIWWFPEIGLPPVIILILDWVFP